MAGYFESAIGQEFKLSSGRETKIFELANMINEIVGNGIQKSRLLASVERARELISYKPKTEFKKGFKNVLS